MVVWQKKTCCRRQGCGDEGKCSPKTTKWIDRPLPYLHCNTVGCLTYKPQLAYTLYSRKLFKISKNIIAKLEHANRSINIEQTTHIMFGPLECVLGQDSLRFGILSDKLHQTAARWSIAIFGPFQKQTKNQLNLIRKRSSIQTYSATNSNGVQVPKSALGIHLRFIGVSNVIGKIATAIASSGRPPSLASDLVRWCTADFATP